MHVSKGFCLVSCHSLHPVTPFGPHSIFHPLEQSIIRVSSYTFFPSGELKLIFSYKVTTMQVTKGRRGPT